MYDSLKETLQTSFGKSIFVAIITTLGTAITLTFSAWWTAAYLLVIFLLYWFLRVYDQRRTEKYFNKNLNDYLNMMK